MPCWETQMFSYYHMWLWCNLWYLARTWLGCALSPSSLLFVFVFGQNCLQPFKIFVWLAFLKFYKLQQMNYFFLLIYLLIIWPVEFSFFQMLLHLKNERLKWTVHTYDQSADISRLLRFPLMSFSLQGCCHSCTYFWSS